MAKVFLISRLPDTALGGKAKEFLWLLTQGQALRLCGKVDLGSVACAAEPPACGPRCASTAHTWLGSMLNLGPAQEALQEEK